MRLFSIVWICFYPVSPPFSGITTIALRIFVVVRSLCRIECRPLLSRHPCPLFSLALDLSPAALFLGACHTIFSLARSQYCAIHSCVSDYAWSQDGTRVAFLVL